MMMTYLRALVFNGDLLVAIDVLSVEQILQRAFHIDK